MGESMMSPEVREAFEKVIRDQAGTVASLVATRRSHPSYGVGKVAIRHAAQRAEGAIGAYMVLDGQAAHSGVTTLAAFHEESTRERVDTMRRLISEL